MSEPTVALVIDDEPQTRRFLRGVLGNKGYRVVEAATGQEGLRVATEQRPEIVLLDLGLPDMDGVEVTRDLRAWSFVPIIVLSVRDREQEKIEALDAGADDYLTKPFGAGELLARMRVALRRSARSGDLSAPPLFTVDTLRVDLVGRAVTVGGRDVHLTPTEYKLLSVLIRSAGRVVMHDTLLREVWGRGQEDEVQYLRVFVAQLRRKIEPDAARPRYLLTVPGIGYRIRVE
jgi:two-component system KDP operon response regulator KdpE